MSVSQWVRIDGDGSVVPTSPFDPYAVHQRWGQAHYNALYAVDPEIANAILGTDADPFHDDNNLPAFFARVAEMREARKNAE